MSKPVKPAGKNTRQTRREVESYQKQMRRTASRIRALAPKPSPTKPRGR